jgi:hypothetical protein
MFRSKKLAALIAGAAAALAVGSFAFAAIPDDNGDIHACYNKDSGALRVTDTATNKPKGCTEKESPLQWNQQGGGESYALDVSGVQVPANTSTKVAERTLPPGRYLTSAKLWVTTDAPNIPATVVSCSLNASGNNGGSSDYAYGTISSNGNNGVYAWVLVASLALQNNNTKNFLLNSGGTVSVYCDSPQPAVAHQIHISALKVASLDYQS